MTVKVSVEIQDGRRKIQRELEMLKNNCDKFCFLFKKWLLFHNTFFLNECENLIEKCN